MYYVYIIFSESTNSFYKGQTNDLDARIHRHNNGFENYTRKGLPWKLIWSSSFLERSEAMALEKKVKNLTRERLISFMLKYSNGIAGPDEFLLLEKLSGC